MRLRQRRVAVIGAGIGGLAAAGALLKCGFEVDVYERVGELGEVGAGIQIGPNGVKVLSALGLIERALPLSAEPENIVSLAWDDAHLRSRGPLGANSVERFGARYLTFHRADLHKVLTEIVPAARIHLDRTAASVAQTREGAVITFMDGRQVEADVVIGADGIHSIVRESLFGVAPARYTQQMGWRTMIPIEFVPTRVGPGNSVAYSAKDYVGWIGPTGHVICYPIRSGTLYNMFVGHVSEEWQEESWTVPSTPAEMMAAHVGWNEALLGMLSRVEHCFKWGIYDRDPLQAWTKGAITLLGDAAHPMMPTLAQGASICLEDAYAIARQLAHHTGDPKTALKAYEAERLPRARRVQLQARQQFENNRKHPAPPPLSRDWIFEHDVTKEPAAA